MAADKPMTKQEQIDQWSKLYGRQVFLESMAQKWHSHYAYRR